MDGKRIQGIDWEKPITKPDYPLPALFSARKRAELPTKRGQRNSTSKMERAHFYRKRTTESGSPVYGFYITSEHAET